LNLNAHFKTHFIAPPHNHPFFQKVSQLKEVLEPPPPQGAPGEPGSYMQGSVLLRSAVDELETVRVMGALF
jgi:hypothetical protein